MTLSRVRSLNGERLTDFDPASIIVSTNCLKEINRLRTIYRKDLSLYDVPKTKNSCKKRRFTVELDEETPPFKKPCCPCIDKQNLKSKTFMPQEELPKTIKSKIKAHKNDDCICTDTVSTNHQLTVWPDLRFYPVNKEWHPTSMQYFARSRICSYFKFCFSYRRASYTTNLSRL